MVRIALWSVMLSASFAGSLAACGDDGGSHLDAPASDVLFTGEVVDWDETDATFCGVFAAAMQVHGDATRSDTTNPNGRFEIMVPSDKISQIDITPPSAQSMCAAGIGFYQFPGIAVANPAVIATGKLISMRMIGMTRLAAFLSTAGITLDPAKAIVFAHVDDGPSPVTVGAAHGQPVAWDGTTWANGTNGVNVVFFNTDVGSGTTSVNLTGITGVGGGSIPVAAGTITYVTLTGS
jgi:hypothetical protein